MNSCNPYQEVKDIAKELAIWVLVFRLGRFSTHKKKFSGIKVAGSHSPTVIITIYAQGCINHRFIGVFMHKKPTTEVSGPILWGGDQVNKGT